ncbi:dual specificity protein phosphatase 3-like [Leptopilina boulardi]|uniref:dual specificity protein phosphatase 3-like n=1 Tax=Leptopilina boulardi TaxID=63433 RepID=UPI0021F5AA08|nr:dual specificity protein phosphatase 3-like [Leptopilina boulardi]XP_051155475.1 dual specificity protein phosphatase 3-like [Leptopilina boulardi]XP_051155476.1 dual specificity protein phosphatase 3-like [Leptopilina boulardi]
MQSTWRDRDRDFQKFLVGGETTRRHLTEALFTTKRRQYTPLPGFDPNIDEKEYYRLQQNIDCDEVYPNIFLGDFETAKNKPYLLDKLKITHLLNCAEGQKFGFCRTDKYYYIDTPIKYLGLPILDVPSQDISQYFQTAADFIEDALKSGGKIYVHCLVGVSRSATCVLAFLMIKRNMLAADAIKIVRQGRDIHPNEGFLQQLAQLDNYLRRSRL